MRDHDDPIASPIKRVLLAIEPWVLLLVGLIPFAIGVLRWFRLTGLQ